MKLDLDALEQAAKAATQGSWEGEEQAVQSEATGGLHVAWCSTGISVGDGGTFQISVSQAEANAAHIATCDPPTILALVTRAHAHEDAVKVIREMAEALEPFARVFEALNTSDAGVPKWVRVRQSHVRNAAAILANPLVVAARKGGGL